MGFESYLRKRVGNADAIVRYITPNSSWVGFRTGVILRPILWKINSWVRSTTDAVRVCKNPYHWWDKLVEQARVVQRQDFSGYAPRLTPDHVCHNVSQSVPIRSSAPSRSGSYLLLGVVEDRCFWSLHGKWKHSRIGLNFYPATFYQRVVAGCCCVSKPRHGATQHPRTTPC